MNYDGHEALRRDMAGLANNLCDLKTTRWACNALPDPVPDVQPE